MKSWEKLIPHGNGNFHRGIIQERLSEVRGIIYDVKGMVQYGDENKGVDVMSGWHDTLSGAKRLFDKEYDIDPSIKNRWILLKGSEELDS